MPARLFAVSCALLCLGVALWADQRELSQPRDLHETHYVSSRECTRCHADHAQSFARTFHRTMTRKATRENVRAPFAGETLDYFGVQARMSRAADGAFTMRYQGPGIPEQTFRIDKTIGSRRYQQYVARASSGDFVRLPVAYDLEEQRWFHMNGAFLTPDPELGTHAALAQRDYERHVTRWNDNCVFCHNVAPNPGMRVVASSRGPHEIFDTEVAELGIACEACHGPGSEHARINTNPLRRYRLHLSRTADPTIVNPERLSPERAADVCGRCHGQRLTDDVNRFLAHGDPFVPGDDLALYSAPLWRDTTLQGQEHVFAARFWSDGTPRLTAYEYQGLLLSRCSAEGTLTCINCHGMHEGDPHGQLRPSRAGAAMCTSCHDSLTTSSAQAKHARHAPEQLPSCVSCHMPNLVFGVISAHPSHHIERPDPALQAQDGRPDACTSCHVTQTRSWAAQQYARMFGPSRAPTPSESSWSEVERSLFGGDPIQRALAASALATRDSISAAQSATMRDRHSAMLLRVLSDDPYPAVRHMALRSLRTMRNDATLLRSFVPESPRDVRTRLVSELAQQLALPALDTNELSTLQAAAHENAIDIGE